MTWRCMITVKSVFSTDNIHVICFSSKKIMPLMCNFIVYRVSLFDLWIKLRLRSRCFKLTRNAEKIRTFFYDIFYTKKNLKPKSFDANYFSFYSRRPFPAGNNQNLSWRCKQVSEMQNEDALLSCTTLQYTRLKGVSLKARFMLINLASGFSLRRAIPCVGFWERKKTKALNMVYFYRWHRWDLFHFLLDSQLLGIFNGFFFQI